MLHKIKRQLEELEAFIATDLHSSYVYTLKTDLKALEDNILNTSPDSEANIALLLTMQGRREELKHAITFFEDTQVVLKQRLLDIEDGANLAPDNENEQNENETPDAVL